MKGRITTIIRKDVTAGRNGGFGFIRDEEDRDRFFHANDLRGLKFAELREGMMVEFDPTDGRQQGNGLRAEQVKRLEV